MRKQIFFLLFLFIGMTACAPSERALVRKGNNKYEAEKYGEAELKYKESLSANEENDLLAAKYNLGNAYYKQERLEEAVMQYDEVLKSAEDDYDKAIAHHNKGNGYLHQYNYMNSMLDDMAGMGMDIEKLGLGGEEVNSAEMLVYTLNSSIESYKDALRKNPGDYDSQYNLAVAQMLLKQYQKEEEQKSQCDNPKDSDENQDKEEKEEEKENEEKPEEEKEQEEQEQSEEKDQEKEGEESEGEKSGEEKSEEEKSEEEKSQEQGEEGEESEEEKEKSESGKEGEEDEEQKEGQSGQDGEENEEPKSAEQAKKDSLLNQMPRKMSKEEVERLLEALKNEELKVQEKLLGKKGKGRRIKTEKDW